MPPLIQILDVVLERLKHASTSNFGNLYGIMYEGKTLIVGFSFETDIDAPRTSNKSFFDPAHVLFPTGIDFCGMIQVGGESVVAELDTICPPVLWKLKDVSVTNNPVYISKSIDTGELEVCYLHGDRLFRTEHTQLTYSEFKQKFIFLRLLGGISVDVQYDSPDNHHSEMEKLSARIAGGMVFRVSDSDVFIYKINLCHTLISTIGNVYDQSVKFKGHSSDMEVLNIYAYFPTSLNLKEGRSISAPFIVDTSYDTLDEEYCFSVNLREESIKLNVALPFDGLCVVHRERTLDDVYSLLIDAAERTVFLSETHIFRHLEDPVKLRKMKTFHFFNNVLCHPLSLIFLQDESDDELVEYRKNIHAYLNIPLERPYFRRGNSLNFLHPDNLTQVLVNVHDGVRQQTSGSPDHLRAHVYGKYGYYHYMMGGINDVGWGCAYRSFQTIFSWFRMQGYTEDEVPSHAEIQEALVKIGDKEASFIGSKTWIGSTEVSFVLDSKLKVNSRILYVSSGSELPTIAPVLLEHFQTHGTPVMIGGGVLAHTIIGVSLNEESGAASFLVLDPHYTGENDVSTIQKKGFVGWKGVNYWDSKAFYNLCLPQRPICF